MEPTPASTASGKEECGEGGSAAFRRLLLEQAEAALPPPAALAEWMALVQHQAIAAGGAAWPHPLMAASWQAVPLVHPGMLAGLLHQPGAMPPLFTSK